MKTRKSTNNNRPPIIITHDSGATFNLLVEMNALFVARPSWIKKFRQRFPRFEDCLIYERKSAIRANRCTAGFQVTRELADFIAALRAAEPENDAASGSLAQ